MQTNFLSPTRAKVALAVGGFLLFPALLLLRAIPPAWDLLDLRQASGAVLGVLVAVPIRLFDLATGSAFATTSESFFSFPSLPQLAAAALGDLLLFYLLACAWLHLRRARPVRSAPS